MKYFKKYNEFITEKIAYPDGDKSTGDKILDKFAKLINSPSSTVNIMSWTVQGRSIPFMTGAESFSVNANPSQDYFWINTSKGKFRLPKKDIKKAEELYDEVESIIQTGKPKRSVEESLNESTSLKNAIAILKKENIMAYPNPEDLAKAIHKHYKEITGDKYEDAVEMSMNDKVADIVSYFKIDGSDFMSAWDKTIKD